MFKFSSLCLFWSQRYVTDEMLCRKAPRLTHGMSTQIAVIATRYLAVFPLASIINFVHRARGQRHDELPHSYQMMLFWAGLRGAVGVALSNGFQGDNAAALRTTVLVVVVLTVIMFGGTTSRMLEVMGIKVGVEEEGSSSDDEGGLLLGRRHEREWLGRSTSGAAPWTGRADVYRCVLHDVAFHDWRDSEIMTLPLYSDGIMAISEAVERLCGKAFLQDLTRIPIPMGPKCFLCLHPLLLRMLNQTVTPVPVVPLSNEQPAEPQSAVSQEQTGLSKLLMNDISYHCFLIASPPVHPTLGGRVGG
jgi:hypothetical protein